jgi:hypothetical protein
MVEDKKAIPPTENLEEFSKNAEAFYKEIKTDLEAKYKGKYAAIDFRSKKYWIGDTASDALSQAKSEYPSKIFYLVQIGSIATFTVQTKLREKLGSFKYYDYQWTHR